MDPVIRSIDFKAIRPFRGQSASAFEEMTVQIFLTEFNGAGEFTRIEGAGGDGGVEAYFLRTDRHKIAIQSKYFERLQASQWSQIDQSVKTALKNHPTIVRYVIAVSANRTPNGVKIWSKLLESWRAYAVECGLTHSIDFDWWGDTELTNFLLEDRFRSQRVYWFETPSFSLAWLRSVNQASIALLGHRYTPQLHVVTETSLQLDAFALGDNGKKAVLDCFVNFMMAWKKINFSKLTDIKGVDGIGNLPEILEQITEFRLPSGSGTAIRNLEALCIEARRAVNRVRNSLAELNEAKRLENKKKNKGKTPSWEYSPWDAKLRNLNELSDTLCELQDQVNICEYMDDQNALLLGEAGTGKSHLLADWVCSAEERSQPVLLLLGERFLSDEQPISAIPTMIGWNHGFDKLLDALEEESALAGRPALLCIDALNESAERRLWQVNLIALANQIASYSNIKLIVSCRTDFAEITLPQAVITDEETKWPQIFHTGFGAESIKAIELYFNEFKVEAPYFPPQFEEFKNPLFLRVFCEAFRGRRVPNSPLSFEQVMNARIDRLCKSIQKEIDCHPADAKAALMAIASSIADNGGQPILQSKARSLTREHFTSLGTSQCLYRRLVSNGIIFEDCRNQDEIFVRFPYERFSDYFIAKKILENITSRAEFQKLFENGGAFENCLEDASLFSQNRGVLRALALLAAEMYSIELPDIITEYSTRYLAFEDFLENLLWRSAESISDRSLAILKETEDLGISTLPALIRLASVPNHPLNSNFLHKTLIGMPLPDRDRWWTISISNLASENNSNVDSFINWCSQAPRQLVSKEQALSVGRLLLWLCGSNYRALRNRATVAAIRLLDGRFSTMISLIGEMHRVNDPYIIERLYAVAAGIAMRSQNSEGLSNLAITVYEAFFSPSETPPNILTRDFASAVLEASAFKKCLPEGIKPEKFRPPFRSKWPKILAEKNLKHFEKDERWNSIIKSIRPLSSGYYGDFGRYQMGAVVHRFSDIPFTKPKPTNEVYKTGFSDKIARRWVLQRVVELGWKPELFEAYEHSLSRGRLRVDQEAQKVERIGKKYQWIALYEFLGYLSDHYWLSPWGDEDVYRGVWQLSRRDFDPSIPLAGSDTENRDNRQDGDTWASIYPDPFCNTSLCANPEKWVKNTPDDFAPIIVPFEGKTNQRPCFVLSGHQTWKEQPYKRITQGRSATLEMWIDVRSFLIRKDDREAFLAAVKGRNLGGSGCDVLHGPYGWIGEYPWGRVYDQLREMCIGNDPWLGDVDIPYKSSACMYESEDSDSFRLPSPGLVEILDIEWTGEGATFRDQSGIIITDHLGPRPHSWGRPLTVCAGALETALSEKGFDIIWCVLSEKTALGGNEMSPSMIGTSSASAVYWLEGGVVKGGITVFD